MFILRSYLVSTTRQTDGSFVPSGAGLRHRSARRRFLLSDVNCKIEPKTQIKHSIPFVPSKVAATSLRCRSPDAGVEINRYKGVIQFGVEDGS